MPMDVEEEAEGEWEYIKMFFTCIYVVLVEHYKYALKWHVD